MVECPDCNKEEEILGYDLALERFVCKECSDEETPKFKKRLAETRLGI